MKTTLIRLSFLFFLPLLAASFCHAGTAAEAAGANERIEARLPQIMKLKDAGDLGETATGYLVPRTDLNAREDSLVNAENMDRKIIYAAVSAETGQTVEEVGRQRAARIALQAKKGIWLQKPDGTWYRK